MSAVPKSTQWARDNKDRVAQRYQERKGTLDGKLINLITQSRYRAKLRGLNHEFDVKFVRELYHKQNGICALSGKVMSIIGERGSDDYWHSVSIDRIDSSKGYLRDNVQLVCTGVNLMKKDMSDEMFIEFCRSVLEYKK